VEALRLVRKMYVDGDIVTVPAVHLFDEEAHIMIIEDCGPGMDTGTLKQLVIDEALPQILAEEIGAEIGHFLARMHAWNKEASFDMGIFTDNEVGKAMTSLVPYSYLSSTLSGQSNITDLADPVLGISKSKLDVLSKLADTRSYEIYNTSESFTHGDFWPGNIMVSLLKDSDEGTPRLDKLYVLDWEMAKAGLQGLDIGEFCTEMHLLQQFYPSRQEEASVIIRSFLSSYNRIRGSDEALARVAIVHIGAHLVAWTPQLHRWGGQEKIRGAVAEGVEFLSGGAEGTRAWLEGSLVGNLLL
jgi:5-methylthioribose kinase